MYCQVCQERRIAAMYSNDLCYNCAPEYRKNHRTGACLLCMRDNVPLEAHHVLTRKYSDLTIDVCCSCHRYITMLPRSLDSKYVAFMAILLKLGEIENE